MWKVDSGEVEFRTTEDIAHNHIENSDMNCSRVGKVEEIVERAEVIRLIEGYSTTMDWFEDYVRSRPITYFPSEQISNIHSKPTYSILINHTADSHHHY